MIRVLQPAGLLVMVAWDELTNNPGLAAEEYLWQQLFGGEIDQAPFCLGDKGVLEELFTSAGATDIQIKTHAGTAQFESIETWIHTGAKGWTEEEAINNDQLELLTSTAEKELTKFRTAAGNAIFPTSAHIVSVRK